MPHITQSHNENSHRIIKTELWIGKDRFFYIADDIERYMLYTKIYDKARYYNEPGCGVMIMITKNKAKRTKNKK